MEIKIEKSNYLNDAHKKIKGDIMVNLMHDIFQPIADYAHELDEQSMMDMILSCLLMFSCEVLTFVLMNSNMLEHRSSLMNTLFNQIKLEVNEEIKNKIAKSSN